MTDADITLAQARAAAARTRLNDTIGQIRTTIDPRPRIKARVDRIAEQGAMTVDTGVAIARDHPRTSAGIATLFVAILARKRISRLYARLRRAPAETTQPSIVRGVRSNDPGARPVKGTER